MILILIFFPHIPEFYKKWGFYSFTSLQATSTRTHSSPTPTPKNTPNNNTSNMCKEEWKRSSVNESEECSICHEVFGDKKLIKLECKHVYHSTCLKKWVKHQQTCPLDRKRFISGVRF